MSRTLIGPRIAQCSSIGLPTHRNAGPSQPNITLAIIRGHMALGRSDMKGQGHGYCQSHAARRNEPSRTDAGGDKH